MVLLTGKSWVCSGDVLRHRRSMGVIEKLSAPLYGGFSVPSDVFDAESTCSGMQQDVFLPISGHHRRIFGGVVRRGNKPPEVNTVATSACSVGV
jgi:hypothetical protein